MGQNKLLLPWPNCKSSLEVKKRSGSRSFSVLDSVLSAWSESQVDVTLIVLRSESQSEKDFAHEIEQVRTICGDYPIEVCTAVNPPDMKASVLIGMKYLQARYSPQNTDRCFISPADLPAINSSLINQLIQRSESSEDIVAPAHAGKRGHPTLMTWKHLSQVPDLGRDQGINAIVKRNRVIETEVSESEFVTDIDTREQYESLLRRFSRT